MPLLKPLRGRQLNRSDPLARALVADWPMNEGAGGVLFDASGNKNTGTLAGNTHFVAGQFGRCLSFDGAADYVNCGSRACLDNIVTKTLCLWFYHQSVATEQVYLKKRPLAGVHNFWTLDKASPTQPGPNKVRYFRAWSTQDGMWYSSTDIVADKWYHLAVTYDAGSTANDPVIYLDGVPETVIEDQAPAGNLGNDSAADLVMGYSLRGGKASLNGLLDHVLIFNRILTADEINLLCRRPFCMFEAPVPKFHIPAAPPPPPAATRQQHIGFRPIEGAERLRGLRLRA